MQAEDHIIDNVADDSGIGLTTQVTDRKKTEEVLASWRWSDFSDAESGAQQHAGTEWKQRILRFHMQVMTRRKSIMSMPRDQLAGMYENANTAIVKADELLGVVINQSHQYIWERGNKATESTIPLVFHRYRSVF